MAQKIASAGGRNLGQVYVQQIAGGIFVHSSPYLTVDTKFSALDVKAYLRLLHWDITTIILCVSEFHSILSGRFTAKIQNVFLSLSMSALPVVSKQASCSF
jgi:hypothetical protein